MTGRDVATAALRLIGAVAPGESLAAQEATDALASINRLISSWSNEGLLIHSITQETFTLVPGDSTVTLGVSGDVTTRPMSIHHALIRDGSTDYPMRILSAGEFSSISDKSTQSTMPQALYDDGAYPRRTLTLYPVPSAAKTLVLFVARPLTEISALSTDLSFPPGYERALVFNAALELAPEYGRPVPEYVMMAAMESKASIKRVNHKPRYLRVDSALVGGRGYNIERGDE